MFRWGWPPVVDDLYQGKTNPTLTWRWLAYYSYGLLWSQCVAIYEKKGHPTLQQQLSNS
jgi:hypothetical protein